MALPLDTLTIETFARELRAGAMTSAALTEACLQRIDAGNDRLRAFTLIMADEARTQASQADRELAGGLDRGPLHGVPISLKDLLDVRGMPTTAASHVRDSHIAAADAPVVARLREAGAVFVGKTNLHEFAYGTTSEESAFGAARNPLDETRTPGGSSGGSAISVATGMALATIGTDTGGSIRIPAAACGIIGLKPALGEVPTDGVVPLSRSLDHVGPLARSVGDAWLVYRALLGQHGPARLETRKIGDLRLAVPRAYFGTLLDEDVRAAFETALDRLRSAGAEVIDRDIAGAELTVPVYITIASADASAYHATTLDEMPERYAPPVRARLELGRYILAEDYVRAMRGREMLRAAVDRALAGYDALVLPTLAIPPPRIGEQSVVVAGKTEPVRALMLRQTQLFNLSGHPAIALPCGRTAEGLPCSLQVVGANTETLVQVARACEAALAAL